MLSDEDMIKSAREINAVVEKYSTKPLEEMVIIRHACWMIESSHVCQSMVTIYGLKEVKK